MKTHILNLELSDQPSPERPESVLSFKPLISYLEQRAREERNAKHTLYGWALERLRRASATEADIAAENIDSYGEVFELIYMLLTQIIDDEKGKLWGLSYPLSPVIFYGTDSLYDIMVDKHTNHQKINVSEKHAEKDKAYKHELLYSFVLNKLYGCEHTQENEFVRAVVDEETGMLKYYKIDFDTRFISVHPLQPLPAFNTEKLSYYLHEKERIDELRRIIPGNLFRFEGISVISMTDVTGQYAIENIKNTIINKTYHTSEIYYTSIIKSLKALAGNNTIEFGLLPVLKINGRMVFDEESCPHSVLVETASRLGVAEKMYMSMSDEYVNNPALLFFGTITEADEAKQPFLTILKQAGICSYGLVPVFYNNQLAGVLEVHAKKTGVLDSGILSKLEPALPFLAQLLQNNVDEFNAGIETIIKEQFTSLQPSVQWKFREAALHYMQQSYQQEKKPDIGPVVFKKVYPLYGAIDIRNSSIERNNATRDDLQYQLTLLVSCLESIKKHYPLALLDEMIYKTKKWQATLQEAPTPPEEYRLNIFFDTEVMPFLEHIRVIRPDAVSHIEIYKEALQETTGKAHEHRRNLEASMQLVNRAIITYLDLMNLELQQSYPFYFEKFRTDGIEYDIYIGQSIAPGKLFDAIYLKNLRLWQLQSMAAIYKMTLGLQSQMQKALYITQLIFINADTIDISFRTDEKKFDVEGAYNIRYQMIKKRIDKVHVKDTGERLTQPGKIALIYFNDREATEYKEYIQYLQEQHIFTPGWEELELEELQGINGLKAMRVTISVD